MVLGSASLLPHPLPQERVLCVTVPIRGDVDMPRAAGYVARRYNSIKSPTKLISDARLHARLGHIRALAGRTRDEEHCTRATPNSWSAKPRYATSLRMCRTHAWSGSYRHNQRPRMNNPHPSQNTFGMNPQNIHGRNSITTSWVPTGTRTP